MSRLLIFDLDGTLLNTLGDLAACCNEVLEAHGYPTHSLERYTDFIGNGVRRLVERALPDEARQPERVELLLQEFKRLYTREIDRYTQPYEGVLPLLQELARRQVPMAILSNKFQAGVDSLVARFFPHIPFVACCGQRPDWPLKPDPAADLALLAQAGVSADQALHVGDSSVDVATARAAGIPSVGVSWGFSPEEQLLEADHLIHHPEELLLLL